MTKKTNTPTAPAPADLNTADGNSRKLRIAGDIVNRATADLPDDQRSLIRWLHGHATDRNLSLEEIAVEIRYNPNTLYQIWTGRHQAGKENICKAIESYQRLAQARRRLEKLAYIETALTRKIWTLCQSALTYQRIGFIFGDSQTGKTTALTEYAARHNHGETIYASMPSGGGYTAFLSEMAGRLRISPRQRANELRERIIKAFDNRMLLIVDEAHQCFATIGPRSESIKYVLPLEFIREIHDRTGCGVIISATNVFRDELDHGRAAPVLKQLRRRRLAALALPNTPTDADLAAFAAAYGLPPATGDAKKLQAEMIRDEALGMWLTLLRMAAKKAAEKGRDLTWDAVARARAGLAKLESPR